MSSRARINGMGDQQLRYMNSNLLHLRQDNAEMRTELSRNYERQNRLLQILNRNIRQIMRNPALSHPQLARTNTLDELDQVTHENRAAVLSNMPKTLQALWNEYEFGIGNNKPAKLFTSCERGKCRYTYHRRKVVWDQIADMVRRGWDAQDACNKLYDVYGHQLSVTAIINQMRKDRRNGGHPSLHNTII